MVVEESMKENGETGYYLELAETRIREVSQTADTGGLRSQHLSVSGG